MSCFKVRRHKDAIVSLAPDQQGDIFLSSGGFFLLQPHKLIAVLSYLPST